MFFDEDKFNEIFSGSEKREVARPTALDSDKQRNQRAVRTQNPVGLDVPTPKKLPKFI